MKALLAALGHLAALRKLNRDDLAEHIGTTRQNLISAFKGRRPLPAAQMPSLRQALGLDDDYRFTPGRVYALTVNSVNFAEKQQNFPLNFLKGFMVWPVRSKWLLRGIGEGSRSAFAYVFEDSRGALVAVRNDDASLGASSDTRMDAENAADPAVQGVLEHMNLFSRLDGSPEREITLTAFNILFQGGMNAKDLRAALDSAAKVWTWTRLKEKAEHAGQSAENVARALGFTGGLD